jgi:hypothetical protein
MTLPIFQRTIVNDAGDVIPGASVEVRRESDNALVQLFSDRDGTVLLSNPTTADSDGFVQFFAASSNYKITATGSGGSVVWRYVDIGSADLRSELAAPTGAAEIGYQPSGAGAVVTDVQAHLREHDLFSNQQDYVDFIASRCASGKMRIAKVAGSYESIRISYITGGVDGKQVSHEVVQNAQDDFYTYFGAFAGPVDLLTTSTANGTFTGSWTTPINNNSYSTTINNSYTFTVTGESVKVNFYADNRGGIFEASIDGGPPITYSTWATTGGNTGKVLATGLSNTAHTVVCTFKGADPLNAPAGGVAARGWAKKDYPGGTSYKDYSGLGGSLFGGAYNDAGNVVCLATGSNKEFALNITHAGETQWFPEHNGVGTAFEVEPAYLLIDGLRVDAAAMPLNTMYEATQIEFVQSVYCRFPIAGVNISRCDISYTFSASGVVNVNGRFTALENHTVNDGYVMMLPLNQATIKEFVSGVGNRHIATADNSYTYLPTEKDLSLTYCGVDVRNPTLAVAVGFDNPIKTLRKYEENRTQLDQFAFIWNRSSAPKLYMHVYKDAPIEVGYGHSFSGRYVVGDFVGAHASTL